LSLCGGGGGGSCGTRCTLGCDVGDEGREPDFAEVEVASRFVEQIKQTEGNMEQEERRFLIKRQD